MRCHYAVLFVRVMCSYGLFVDFLVEKCGLALMKNFQIVFLELLSCLMLSQLVTMVVKAVGVEMRGTRVFFWSN